MEDQRVNITFGEQKANKEQKKEVPLWISESTVEKRVEDQTASSIAGIFRVDAAMLFIYFNTYLIL